MRGGNIRPRIVLRRCAAAAGLIVCAVILKCAGGMKEPAVPSIIKSKAAGAAAVGSEACAGCHEDIFKRMDEASGIHRMISGKPVGDAYCESCHGPGSVHAESMDAAGIFNKEDMKKLSKEDQSGACLSCHQTMRMGWTQSPHAGDRISCWDCHGDAMHGSPEDFGIDTKPAKAFLQGDGGAFCGQCHEAEKMQLVLQYHHPVPEGKMDCTSCHAVHGEADRIETSIEPSLVCTLCHAEMAGPWVFEHEAMNEGCPFCHEAHGSANRKLLVMPNNTLCLQCHFQTAFPTINGMNHELFVGAGATCWQCHFEVHGSNSSPSLSPGR